MISRIEPEGRSALRSGSLHNLRVLAVGVERPLSSPWRRLEPLAALRELLG
jgi:hypothetical protein